MHSRLLARGSVVVALLLAGCGGEEPLAVQSAPVVGGMETGEARPEVLYVTAEVRALAGLMVVKIGSGTLVAPNLLATALHVISENPSNVPFTCDASGNDVSGSLGAHLGAQLPAEKIAVYAGPTPQGEPLARGLAVVSTGSPTICENDLAFVILDRALELPVVPVRRGGVVQVGEPFTTVGYGTNVPDAVVMRTERQVTAVAVGQWIRTFTVSEGPCEGDSGGPALSADGQLAGVFSSVAVDCTGPNAAPKYTDMGYFGTLVERAFDEAGAGDPWGSAVDGGAGGASSVPEPAEGGLGSSPRQERGGGCSVARAEPSCGQNAARLALFAWLLARVGARARRGEQRSRVVRRREVSFDLGIRSLRLPP